MARFLDRLGNCWVRGCLPDEALLGPPVPGFALDVFAYFQSPQKFRKRKAFGDFWKAGKKCCVDMTFLVDWAFSEVVGKLVLETSSVLCT